MPLFIWARFLEEPFSIPRNSILNPAAAIFLIISSLRDMVMQSA